MRGGVEEREKRGGSSGRRRRMERRGGGGGLNVLPAFKGLCMSKSGCEVSPERERERKTNLIAVRRIKA